jgi:E3 ubiquitin-protein ligase RNF14
MEDAETDDERAEELSTLQSIYPELVIDANDPFSAALDLLVAPSKPLPVIFGPEQDIERLSYLPSLHIDVVLPPTYPAETPPSVRVMTTPPWLPSDIAQKLADEAAATWDEYGGGMILFSYISSLQEQAETAFGLEELRLALDMKHELVVYSKRLKRELFDRETWSIPVGHDGWREGRGETSATRARRVDDCG